MNDNIEESYRALINRKRFFFLYFFAMPLFFGLSSLVFSEDHIFIAISVYMFVAVIWALYLYFSACPSCGGLFYGAKYSEKGIGMHKFFLNKKCNQCGFTQSTVD